MLRHEGVVESNVGSLKRRKGNGWKMKFTVLMSVYAQENHKNFTTALESILINQTVIPDEFVLVCDGPLNAELDAVISRFHTNFPDIFKVYRLEHNGGLGNALNVGMKLCQNEIIARADSDDICDSQRFEKQLDFLCAHLDVAAVGTAIDEFNTCLLYTSRCV